MLLLSLGSLTANLLMGRARYRVDILVKVHVVERVVVDREHVALDGRQQYELLLVGDAEVSDGFRWYGERVQKFICFDVPYFHVFLTDSEDVLSVQLAKTQV